MLPRQNLMYVTIRDWILERKKWYYYLIPPDPFGKLEGELTIPVEEGFFKTAAGYMNAFLEKRRDASRADCSGDFQHAG